MNRSLVFAAVGLTAAGAACFSHQFRELWLTWTSDGLRSVGLLAIPASLGFLIPAWIRSGWVWEGSWWGLVPVGLCLLGARADSQGFVGLLLPGGASIPFLPVSLLLFGYSSGVVLLFGGTKPWRAGAFGLALLLFVNPLPQFLTGFVDVPLQFAAAQTARAFASLLRVPVSGQSLRLMFAPGFGMFIAPGCNGLRGTVSMAFLTLVLGRLWGLGGLRHALFVAAAVPFAYVLNLARLCSLVLYYRLALWVVPLQHFASAADFVVGATLFALATAALFGGVRLQSAPAVRAPSSPPSARLPEAGPAAWAKLGALAALILGFCSLPYWPRATLAAQIDAARQAKGHDDLLPHRIGQYHASRSWRDADTYAPTVDLGAAYQRDARDRVQVDLLLDSRSAHDSATCHLIRGEKPLWRQLVTFDTADGSATFDAVTFEQGTHTVLEASTECSDQGCTALPLGRRLIPLDLTLSGLLWRLHTIVPVEITTEEVTSVADGPEAVRQRLLERLKALLAALDLAPLQQYCGALPSSSGAKKELVALPAR